MSKKTTKKSAAKPKTATPPPPEGHRGYETRVCVPAPMPVKCPKCGGYDTRADGGTFNVYQTRKRFAYRTCRACEFKFVSVRDLTPEEAEKAQ